MLARVRQLATPTSMQLMVCVVVAALGCFISILTPWFYVRAVPGNGSPSYELRYWWRTAACVSESAGNYSDPCAAMSSRWRERGASRRGPLYDATATLAGLALGASVLLLVIVRVRHSTHRKACCSSLGNVLGIAAPVLLALSVITFSAGHARAFDAAPHDKYPGPWSSFSGTGFSGTGTKRIWGPYGGYYAAIATLPFVVYVAWAVRARRRVDICYVVEGGGGDGNGGDAVPMNVHSGGTGDSAGDGTGASGSPQNGSAAPATGSADSSV